MEIFEVNANDDTVHVNKLYMSKDSIFKKLKEADKTRGNEGFNRLMKYLYFVYDRRSKFKDVPLKERQFLVSRDFCGDEKYFQAWENNESIKKLISLLNTVQFTKDEQALEAARIKIDEFGELLRNTPLDLSNQNSVKSLIENYEDLLKLKERLERLVLKESIEKAVGGGDKKMFEDD
jgi:hypothetical protein